MCHFQSCTFYEDLNSDSLSHTSGLRMVYDVTLSSIKRVCCYAQTFATAAVLHATLHNTMRAPTVSLKATQRPLCEPSV